ncbi:hypothetical protein CMV_016314 [Castanea mollissima]|uniref:Uncharacterized protein n=1 Tax=Castanea mollissima TaxID=60419 RepID=A0A8J4R7C3_9ROSI|nr:hypothetical protein CMV_016314 [Castanea mollissima]
MEEPSSASKNQVMVDGDGGEVKGGEIPRFEIKVTHEAKLNEILHKINSIEIKLCYDGVKEFIKLLKSHDPALFDSEDVQSIIECLYPCPFIWSLINKGLLHSDFLVKYGTLRLLSEALKLLDWTPSLEL